MRCFGTALHSFCGISRAYAIRPYKTLSVVRVSASSFSIFSGKAMSFGSLLYAFMGPEVCLIILP
jgi:hypothetical protein